jgi:hypothetical protein
MIRRPPAGPGVSSFSGVRETLPLRGGLREMIKKVQWILFGLLLIGLAGCLHQRGSAEDRTPRMTKEELKAMTERPETVIIIDIRVGSTAKRRIVGAVREDPKADPRAWAYKYSKDSVLVFYCA